MAKTLQDALNESAQAQARAEHQAEMERILMSVDSRAIEERCVVDGWSREIAVPERYRFIGIESDEKVVSIPFACPKMTGNGTDMSEMNIYINYMNAAKEKNRYLVEDVRVEGDNIVFSWVLSRHVTQYKGFVEYIICAKKSGPDGNTTNEWNSKVAQGIVGEGFEVLTPGEIEEHDHDIIEQILIKLGNVEDASTNATENAKKTAQDRKAVEVIKTEVIKQKALIDNAVSDFTTTSQQVKADAVKVIQAEGTKQVQAITAEGTKQKEILDAAAQSIVADREQIQANKESITELQKSKGNLDENLNAVKSDLKNTDNKVQALQNSIGGYTDKFFQNYFALQRTDKKYTVKFPMWETSQVSTGEKLDDNVGLIIEPSTMTEKGRDDYENIPLFRTYDCNVEKVDGKLKITAMKGDANYDPKEKDTFVLGMPYYHKTWIEGGYLYYSRSDTKHDGYVLCKEAEKTGGMRNFCLYAKYVAGRNSKGTLGSYFGVAPVRNLLSYNECITEGKKRGTEYCFGSSYDVAYIQTSFMLKCADRNWNNKLGGCFNYQLQYAVSKPESNVKRVVLAKANADKFIVGSCVSVGDLGQDTNKDRGNAKLHNICDNVKILRIEDVDSNNKALVLDVKDNITTTATTWVTSMHWMSGFSDEIKGRDGCRCQAKSQITSLAYPSVIQGIECMVGGYETLGNAFMDLIDGLHRDIYICDDVAKLTTDVATAKSTYTKLAKQMAVPRNNQWNYNTEMEFDIINGMNYMTRCGDSGSGSNSGYCDGTYFDAAITGQREFRCFGALWDGLMNGSFCVLGNFGLSAAWWSVLARLSLNVFRGEFA